VFSDMLDRARARFHFEYLVPPKPTLTKWAFE